MRWLRIVSCVLLAFPARADEIRELPLETKDLVADPWTGRLYVTIPGRALQSGNSVAAIDPATGALGPVTPVGGEPGKLALSDDGRALYVALDQSGAVQRLALPDFTPQAAFTLGAGPRGAYFVHEMAVLPGSTDTLVIARRAGSPSGAGAGVAVYDGAARRPEVAMETWESPGQLVFGGSPSLLYGSQGTFGSLYRMTVDARGVLLRDELGGYAGEIVYSGGRLYGARGWVIDPEAGTLLGRFAPPAGPAPIAVDAARARAFMLVSTRDGVRLIAFDTETFLPVASLPIPGVRGETADLVRWGEDGLAFRTGGGQVFLIRTPLVPPLGSADLAVDVVATQDTVIAGETVTLTFIVTNHGPAAARDVSLQAARPPGAALVSARTSQGEAVVTGDRVRVAFGALAPRSRALAHLRLRPDAIGTLAVSAAATAETVDANPENNAAARSVAVVAAASALRGIRRLTLPTGDHLYDPAGHRILATLPARAGSWGNSLVAIDPRSGEVTSIWSVGSDPARLALSTDGRSLFIGLDGAGAIRRFDLAGGFLEPPFSLGGDPRHGPYRALEIEPMPATPDSLAVVRSLLFVGEEPSNVAIFDGATPRPGLEHQVRPRFVRFSDSPSRLYGTGGGAYLRMEVDAGGIRTLNDNNGGPPFLRGPLDFAGGRLYDALGQVVDAERRGLLGTFHLETRPAPFLPDPASGRVYYLTGQDWTRSLVAFSDQSFHAVGSLPVPGVSGPASRLIRWGEDGFAFRSRDDQLFLLQTDLMRAPDSTADLDLQMTAAPNPVIAGETLTYTLVVTNAGPQDASGVQLSLVLPAGVQLLRAQTTQGSISERRNQVTEIAVALGVLARGARATVTLTVRPSKVGTLVQSAQVEARERDPDPANNMAQVESAVAARSGPDLVGTPTHLAGRCVGFGSPVRCRLSVGVRVQNQGAVAAPPSVARFYLSADAVLDAGDRLLHEARVPALKSGAAKALSFSLSLPRGIDPRGSRVIVLLDATRQVTETEEENNVVLLGPVP